jgi:hypothetical protein
MNGKDRADIVALANDNLRNVFRLTLLLVPMSAVAFGGPSKGGVSFFSSDWMIAVGLAIWLIFEGVRISIARHPSRFRGLGGLGLVLSPILLLVGFFSIAVFEEDRRLNFLNLIALVGVVIVTFKSCERWGQANRISE